MTPATSPLFTPPGRARSTDASAAFSLLGLHRRAGDHRNVLRPKPVGCAGRDALQRLLGIGKREPRLVLQIVALCRGQGGAAVIALAIVDDAELVPGERIAVVAA